MRKALVLLAAVSSVGLTARLGYWQLGRAAEKLDRQAAIGQRETLPALDNSGLPCDGAAWSAQAHRRVWLDGHWLPRHTWLLDNRAMAGRAGFYVVTAMALHGGHCGARVVLVQRGWVPRNAADRARLPPFVTPDGPVRLVGRLMPELSRSYSLGADLPASAASGPRIVQNTDLAQAAAELGQAVLPGAVLQLQPEAGNLVPAAVAPSVFPLLREWPVPASDVGKHHAYAAQWFAMAALITGLYVWFQLVSPYRRRPH